MSTASRYVDKFLTGMESSGISLYNEVVQYLRRLDTTEEGALFSSPHNTSMVNSIAGIMQQHVDNPAYERRVSDLINSVSFIADEVTRKYKNLPDEAIEGAIRIHDRYQYSISGVLDDENVVNAIMVPYINDIFFAIGNRSELDSLINQIRDSFPTVYRRFFITQVTTQLEQFERELRKYYSDYLGIKRYRFTGPKDELNRDWCHNKVGKVYTEKQIQAWADEDWEGRIPGTDSLSIFVNLGGFNCRHILEPV